MVAGVANAPVLTTRPAPACGKATRRGPMAALTLLVMAVALSFAGCPCVNSVVNASPELRWFLFSKFGASRVCPEMTKRGVSLRLQDRQPAIGRFFPLACQYNIDEARKTITVHVAGTGYGYMMPAKRVGFSLTASVEYRPDFQIAGDDVYVWGKLSRIVQGPNFQLGYVENRVVDVAANIPPFGSIANLLGNQVVSSALARGFTVVHNEDLGDDFALGILFPPAKPHKPFEVTDASERYTFANETVDVQANQRDYLGPFEITKPGQALHLTLQAQGPDLDVMIVDKRTGDFWREAYQTGQPLGPPPGPILAGGPLRPGFPDMRRYPLPPGQYYVVVDNTAAAGLVAPPAPGILSPIGGGAGGALVSYVAQLGK